MRIETTAVHAGRRTDPATGAVAPPIQLSTTFERAENGSFPHGFIYSRNENPNRQGLEECLQALEVGAAVAVFSSGSAATASIFQAIGPNSHVIAPVESYTGTKVLLRELFATWNLEATFVDMTNPDELQAALRPNTRLNWTEPPSNPLLKITDVATVAEIAHQAGAICVCDSTWCTPVIQRPFEFGADVVVHATTKYFGGHSDVLGGVAIFREETDFAARVRRIQVIAGAVPSPFDCWLILRGVSTLPWRVRAHCENAMQIAVFLSQHAKVDCVYYPGLERHPGHALSVQQMSMF